jgi:hypothetical protein
MLLNMLRHIRLASLLAILLANVLLGRMQAQNSPTALQVGITQQQAQPRQLGIPTKLFPQHVIQNPQGFSPLCRMELQIERQSPVGVWFRIDGNRLGSVANPGLASFRLKFPIGSR